MTKIKKQKGFTLVEVIVVIIIISVITSVAVFNHRDFNDSVELTNQAYEVALLAREAQISGISVRQSPGGGADAFKRAWGIHSFVDSSAGINSSDTKIILFVDLDDNGTYIDGFDCPPGECVSVLEMRRGNIINKLCRVRSGGMPIHCGDIIAGISTTFFRPKPDAAVYFYKNDGGQIFDSPGDVGSTRGIFICLESPLGRRKAVRILRSGQISVEEAPPECI